MIVSISNNYIKIEIEIIINIRVIFIFLDSVALHRAQQLRDKVRMFKKYSWIIFVIYVNHFRCQSFYSTKFTTYLQERRPFQYSNEFYCYYRMFLKFRVFHFSVPFECIVLCIVFVAVQQ